MDFYFAAYTEGTEERGKRRERRVPVVPSRVRSSSSCSIEIFGEI